MRWNRAVFNRDLHLGTAARYASYDRVTGLRLIPRLGEVRKGWWVAFKHGKFFSFAQFRPGRLDERSSNIVIEIEVYTIPTTSPPYPSSISFSLFLLKALPINPFRPTLQAFSFRGHRTKALRPFNVAYFTASKMPRCKIRFPRDRRLKRSTPFHDFAIYNRATG